MKLLITGGTGLVGTGIKSIASEFLEYNISYMSSKDCNLLDYGAVMEYFWHESPDCIIHLAANVGGLYKNMNQKVEMFDDNIQMNLNVIKAAFSNDIKNLIGTLSTCIFPDNTTYPINETMLHDGAPHTSNDAYAYAKRMIKVQCDAYSAQHDVNYSCIIPTNIYGEGDNFSLEDGHVIPALIHKCFNAVKNGIDFEVYGTGKPLRQFIYSKDLGRLILKSVYKLMQESIILAPREEVAIGDVARYIARAFDYEDRMVFNDSFSDGQYKKTADNSKLMELFPDFEFMKIEEGIAETVDYFRREYPNLRL